MPDTAIFSLPPFTPASIRQSWAPPVTCEAFGFQKNVDNFFSPDRPGFCIIHITATCAIYSLNRPIPLSHLECFIQILAPVTQSSVLQVGRAHSLPPPPEFPLLALPDTAHTTSARQTTQNADMMCTHLDFEGVSVIGAWCKISMYSGTATERSRVGAIVIKSKAIPVTGTI